MYFFKRTTADIGKIGENKIYSTLRRISVFGKHGKILRNVYIPTNSEFNTEIDILYITEKGIFVIESKNMAGNIIGSFEEKEWTQKYFHSARNWLGLKVKETHNFYNPIWQNRTHIGSLKKILNNVTQYFSTIVFSENTNLDKIIVDSDETLICKIDNLKYVINTIWKAYPTVLTDSEIESIYNVLLPYEGATKEEKKKHIEEVKEIAEKAKNKCPLCGSELVLRTAKKGKNAGHQFYGCSNYPKCDYIQNIR